MYEPTGTAERPLVVGVMVSYNPDPEAIRAQLVKVVPQVQRIVLVDNGSTTDLGSLADDFGISFVPLGENHGISYAQNVGISAARELNADFVLLLDQDSLPAEDMVSKLLWAADVLRSRGVRYAAIGANYVDPRQGEECAFVYRKGLRLKRRAPSANMPIVETDFLIASGSLIPMAVLEDIGGMVDELFIDYVDIEWGLRAKARGYSCFGVYDARMEHALGDDHISFRKHKVPLHSPLRHYYQLRNAIWLTRQPWLPRVWTLLLAWRMFRQFIFFTLAAPNGLAHARMMTAGIIDGFNGHMGRK